MSKVVELFGQPTSESKLNWADIVSSQHCPYLDRKCLKNRKSEPEISIGTCTMKYGEGDVIICPFRLLERRQIFLDCMHLLTLHEPGNELHVVSEVEIPGGNVDYFLVSVSNGKVMDFVGIELQTLDTTGTVWPERQRFLHEKGIPVKQADIDSRKPFGMNWKMTAKTILVQLHHKLTTFEHLNKHLVLVIQDHLMAYMRREFSFDHVKDAKLGDSMHFHSYGLNPASLRLQLASRHSTDVVGMELCLGLQSEAKVDLEIILTKLQSKISEKTLLKI
ncbi:hypothetical protein HT747_04175 [Brevibacillus borstelensis]|nr:hypothetical protein [Brevibacillus borstelensis]